LEFNATTTLMLCRASFITLSIDFFDQFRKQWTMSQLKQR